WGRNRGSEEDLLHKDAGAVSFQGGSALRPTLPPRGEETQSPSQMRRSLDAPGMCLLSLSCPHSLVCSFTYSRRQQIDVPPRLPSAALWRGCVSRPSLQLPLRGPGLPFISPLGVRQTRLEMAVGVLVLWVIAMPPN
ncbi:hypothetical protein TcCL_NonESM13754, partial [Trypanosoma cruzi]